ncbi:MAG: hypothetical protein ACTHLR_12360 [Rhizomicrobium sp.]
MLSRWGALAMDRFAGTALLFLSQYGIYAAGIAAVLSYLAEVYSGLRRTGPATTWSNVKMIARLGVTTISVGVALFILVAQYEKKTGVAKAAEDIVFTYHDCLDATKDIPAAEIGAMAAERPPHPVELQCLAFAVKKFAPDHAAEQASVALAEDEELGHRLLNDPAKDNPISNTLYDSFGINGDTFLGTGYSVPRAKDDEEIRYGDARMREYLVPNYCAMSNPPCARRYDTIWSWTVEPRHLSDYDNIESLLETRDANADPQAFRDLWKRQGKSAGWLIRFQMFPRQKYKGTVGRPNATYVFFSELDQALKMSLRDAVRTSGSTSKEIDSASDDKMVFVWVAAPAETNDYTKIATWQNVFLLLKNVDVSDSVKAKMVRRSPPAWRALRDKSS